LWETLEFIGAAMMAAFDTLVSPFADHLVFANETSLPIELVVATSAAECAVVVIGRRT
jgi:hypothetical protein